MKITGAKDISKKIQKELGKYSFEVGILADANKKKRKKGATKNYAGLTISGTGSDAKTKGGGKISLVYIAQVLEKYHFKWLTKPFTLANNKEIIAVVKEIAEQTFGKKSPDNRRLENAVQAVVRNPILRGDYGNNASSTVKQKGFNKLGIDTGQFFKAIRAKRI
jgi:hypothetical protein